MAMQKYQFKYSVFCVYNAEVKKVYCKKIKNPAEKIQQGKLKATEIKHFKIKF
jgi:hypothetical protein